MTVRRWATAGVVGILGLGLGMQPAGADGAERAAGETQSTYAYTVALLQDGAGCNNQSIPLTGPEPSNMFVPLDGKTHTAVMDRRGTTSGATLRGTGSVSGRVVSTSQGLRKSYLTATVAASVTPGSSPRPCTVMTNALGGVEMDVTATKKSWLVVRSSGSAVGHSEAGVEVSGTTTPLYVVIPKGRAVVRLVPPGSYNIHSFLTSKSRLLASGTATVSSRATMSGTAALVPVGTRRSLTGSGTGFVAAGHRNCTSNEVRVAFSRAARTRTRSITFYVNGERRVVLRGRALIRSSIVLRRIAPASAGVIKAVVRTRSGARRTMASTSWPCR